MHHLVISVNKSLSRRSSVFAVRFLENELWGFSTTFGVNFTACELYGYMLGISRAHLNLVFAYHHTTNFTPVLILKIIDKILKSKSHFNTSIPSMFNNRQY